MAAPCVRPLCTAIDVRAGLAQPGHSLRRLAVGLWLAQALIAAAAPLADPTRPPAAPSSGAGPTSGRSVARQPAPPSPPPPLPALPALQAVHVPAQGPALALVEGQQVRTGDTLAGRQVVAIDSQGLTLQGRDGQERLLLLAGTPKQLAGSIPVQRSAGFSAAPTATGGGAETDTVPRPTRGANSDLAQSLQGRPANTGPLSLAGKTSP